MNTNILNNKNKTNIKKPVNIIYNNMNLNKTPSNSNSGRVSNNVPNKVSNTVPNTVPNSVPHNTIGNNINKTNMNMNMNTYTEKAHYYLGFKVNDNNFIYKIKSLQKNIISKKKYNDSIPVKQYFIKFLYIGYLDYKTYTKYMNKILQNILVAIGYQFGPLVLTPSVLDVTGISHNNLILQFNNSILNDKIIPFLQNNAIKPIYGRSISNDIPYMDILTSLPNDSENSNFEYLDAIPFFNLSNIKLTFNNICVIREEPVDKKAGTQSRYTRMIYDVMDDRCYNLSSSNSI